MYEFIFDWPCFSQQGRDKIASFLMYAGHDSGLKGLKSPVGRTSGTTSRRQLRSKQPWEGSRRQDYRHDEQEPNRRPRLVG